MTQPTPALVTVPVQICGDCDGFPVVAIDTGTLHADGTRATLRVTCSTCQGTGNVALRAPRTASVGR